MAGTSVRTRTNHSKWFFIPITLGALVFVLNGFVWTDLHPHVQNLLNWIVGVGLVGGSFSLLIYNVSKGKASL